MSLAAFLFFFVIHSFAIRAIKRFADETAKELYLKGARFGYAMAQSELATERDEFEYWQEQMNLYRDNQALAGSELEDRHA